jgi:hypothetical protein
MTHVQIAIWAYRGPQSGQILSMDRADADQAIADAWGQDMAITDGRHLIYAAPPGPLVDPGPHKAEKPAPVIAARKAAVRAAAPAAATRAAPADDGADDDGARNAAAGDEGGADPAPRRTRGRPRKGG